MPKKKNRKPLQLDYPLIHITIQKISRRRQKRKRSNNESTLKSLTESYKFVKRTANERTINVCRSRTGFANFHFSTHSFFFSTRQRKFVTLALAAASHRGGTAIVAGMPFIDDALLWCPDNDGRLVDISACLQVCSTILHHHHHTQFSHLS